MKQSNFAPDSISWVRWLFFITALILFIFSMGSFMRLGRNPDNRMLYLVYAALMFADGLAMLVCGLFFDKFRQAYWFSVVVLGVNILLIIFDQVGLVDILFLLLNAIVLGMLISARKSILAREANA